jgi:molybdenum cofactor biosynthesis enzyme MoaA
MNYYKILRLNRLVKSDRIKIFGLAVLYVFKKRYLNVFLDPNLTCNFRCRMCYFSDPEYKPEKKRMDLGTIGQIADNFFKYALKLQIGCGAEPSLYLHNEEIIKAAKTHNVPHISFTTNASLLNYEKIKSLAESGLDEIIISMHGTQKEVYESMMPGAKFEKLHEVLTSINKIKNEYPQFKLRINYTVNPDNIDDLANFDEYLERYKIDILQIRPIRKLGNTSYSDFDLKRKQLEYSNIIDMLENKCHEKSVVSLITHKLPDSNIYRKTLDVAKHTYCYISPLYFGIDNYHPVQGTYRKQMKKNKFLRTLFKEVFFTKNVKYEASQNFGNYDVNI